LGRARVRKIKITFGEVCTSPTCGEGRQLRRRGTAISLEGVNYCSGVVITSVYRPLSLSVRFVIEFLLERRDGHAERGFSKFYFSNAAAETLNDAPSFLISQVT
jgi:hypothetical protein